MRRVLTNLENHFHDEMTAVLANLAGLLETRVQVILLTVHLHTIILQNQREETTRVIITNNLLMKNFNLNLIRIAMFTEYIHYIDNSVYMKYTERRNN